MSILTDVINEDVKAPETSAGKWMQYEVYAFNAEVNRWVFWSQHHDKDAAKQEAAKLLRAPNVDGVRVETA